MHLTQSGTNCKPPMPRSYPSRWLMAVVWVAAYGRGSRWLPVGGYESEVGKQSHQTILDVFERYIEAYMTLFDTV